MNTEFVYISLVQCWSHIHRIALMKNDDYYDPQSFSEKSASFSQRNNQNKPFFYTALRKQTIATREWETSRLFRNIRKVGNETVITTVYFLPFTFRNMHLCFDLLVKKKEMYSLKQ